MGSPLLLPPLAEAQVAQAGLSQAGAPHPDLKGRPGYALPMTDTWIKDTPGPCSSLSSHHGLLAFPDDHSRVILSQVDGVPCSDYINASYIDVS